MADVPPQRFAVQVAPVGGELVARLSVDMERAIAFAEDCRWHCPELSAQADALAEAAMALFGQAVRSLRAQPVAADR